MKITTNKIRKIVEIYINFVKTLVKISKKVILYFLIVKETLLGYTALCLYLYIGQGYNKKISVLAF